MRKPCQFLWWQWCTSKIDIHESHTFLLKNEGRKEEKGFVIWHLCYFSPIIIISLVAVLTNINVSQNRQNNLFKFSRGPNGYICVCYNFPLSIKSQNHLAFIYMFFQICFILLIFIIILFHYIHGRMWFAVILYLHNCL